MNIIQTAEALGLTVRTVREWIKTGRIPAKKIGKSWEIPENIIFSEEVQQRADKGRQHSKRIEAGKTMGLLAGRSEDTKKSI